MAQWGKSYSPTSVLKLLESSRIAGENRNVAFTGFEVRDCFSVLESMIVFNFEVPPFERSGITRRGVASIPLSTPLSPESVLKKISTLEREYLSQKARKFVLVTSISLSPIPKPLSIAVGSSRIRLGGEVPRKLSSARSELLENAKSSIDGNLPTNYLTVMVRTCARSTHGATDTALRDLDLLRAAWNLWNNRRAISRVSMGLRAPINAIILAPVHTLHDESLRLATDTWWYETNFRRPVALWGDSVTFPSALAFSRKLMGKLDSIPYSTSIVDALVRYVRALDSSDWNSSFLQLWSVLELTTDTGNQAYSVTVRRTAFHYLDHEYTTQLLLHLKDFRNQAVHSGRDSNDIEQLLYRLKLFVEQLLMFHVRRAGQFKSISDACGFMDLPCDRDVIAEQIKRLRMAKNFLH
jgi:hypothetical protein